MTWRRTLAKALSWRALSLVLTGVVAYALFGSHALALTFVGLDSAVKVAAFIVHERLWR